MPPPHPFSICFSYFLSHLKIDASQQEHVMNECACVHCVCVWGGACLWHEDIPEKRVKRLVHPNHFFSLFLFAGLEIYIHLQQIIPSGKQLEVEELFSLQKEDKIIYHITGITKDCFYHHCSAFRRCKTSSAYTIIPS